MSNALILVVDDEPQLRRVMRATLAELNYTVIEAKTGEEAVEMMRHESPDLILLDLNMPGMGGLAACRMIRANSDVAIVVLSVRDTEREKVQALDAGADDYVTKPFSVDELLARIRAALRRVPGSPEHGPSLLRTEDFEMDFKTRTAMAQGKTVRLTPKEFDLLRYLVLHPNEPVPHRELLQNVWGPDYGGELEYLRVFMNTLRKKIEPVPSKPKYLLTEARVGYRLAISPNALTKP